MKNVNPAFMARFIFAAVVLGSCNKVTTIPQNDAGSNFNSTFAVDEKMSVNIDLEPFTKGNKFTISAGPTKGKLTFEGFKGTYLAADFSAGEDTFVVQWDGPNGPLTGVFRITIRGVNHAPKAYDVPLLVKGEEKTYGKLIAKDYDGDHLTFSILSATSKGKTVLNADTGRFVYVPKPAAVGTDSFTYEVSDGKGGSAQGTQVIAINSNRDIAILETRVSNDIQIPPVTSVDFESRPISSEITKAIYIYNAGGVSATAVQVALNSQYFSVVNGCAAILPPKQTCNLSVTFKPLLPGTLRADIGLSYISDSKPINSGVALAGMGLRPAKLSYQMLKYSSPGFTNITMVPGGSYSFGDITSPSPDLDLVLINTGDIPAAVTALSITSASAQNEFSPPLSFPLQILPGANTTAHLRFNSANPASVAEDLLVKYQDGLNEIVESMRLEANIVVPARPILSVVAGQELPPIMAVSETYSTAIKIQNNDTHARRVPELMSVPAYALVSQTSTTCGPTLAPNASCIRNLSVSVTQPSQSPVTVFKIGDSNSWLELYEGLYSGGSSAGKTTKAFSAQKVQFRGSLGLGAGSNGIFDRAFYLHNNAPQRNRVITLKALTNSVSQIRANFTAAFEFLGGGYPGTGGTCGSSLGINQTCTMVVRSTSVEQKTSVGSLNIGYYDGIDGNSNIAVNLSQELFGCLDPAVPMANLTGLPAERDFWGVSPVDGTLIAVSDNLTIQTAESATAHIFRCDGMPLGTMQLSLPNSTPTNKFPIRMSRFIPGTSKFLTYNEYVYGRVAIVDPLIGSETILDTHTRIPFTNIRTFYPMVASDGSLAVIVGAFDSTFNFSVTSYRYTSNGVFVGTGPGFSIPRAQIPWDNQFNSIAHPFTSRIDADESSMLILISQNATQKTHVFKIGIGAALSYQEIAVANLDPCTTQNMFSFPSMESARSGNHLYPITSLFNGQTCISKYSTTTFDFDRAFGGGVGRINLSVVNSLAKGIGQNSKVANSTLWFGGTRITSTCSSPNSCSYSTNGAAIFGLNLSNEFTSWRSWGIGSRAEDPTFLFGNTFLTPPAQGANPQSFSRGILN